MFAVDPWIPFAAGIAALGLLTHVVLVPERYLRRPRAGSFLQLVRFSGGDAGTANRLVDAELERGARSREQAARRALARLLKDRSR